MRHAATLCASAQGREIDELVLDLSPLRTPATFEEAAAFCLSRPEALGGCLEALQQDATDDGDVDAVEHTPVVESLADEGGTPADSTASARGIVEARTDDYSSLPIHRLPMYICSWEKPRPEAKALAKALAQLLGTAMVKKGRSKALGGPKVKPGKSRRHGGYGIG